MKIGSVITAWNEGDEVEKTIKSLLESTRHAEVRVFLVDDGSTDGSCDGFGGGVTVIRHDESKGIGVCRNAGWAAARGWGADVVTFHDAHMRFPEGGLEVLADRALATGNFVCAGSRGMSGRNVFWGCNLLYDPKDGFRVKWAHLKWPDTNAAWIDSMCPMGAGYCLSMETARKLAEPTGRLWENVVGRWGFSEQNVAVKCALKGVKIEFSRDVLIRHLYRKKNPVPGAAKAYWANLCFATTVLLGRENQLRWFGKWCEQHLGKERVAALMALAESGPHVAPTAGEVLDALPCLNPPPQVTVCVLNWKRPEHIGPLLDCLKAQTVPVQVFLWNNGAPLKFLDDGGAEQSIAKHPLVKLYVESSRNLGCLPRWWLASQADTEFVCSLDDDLLFRDPKVLEDAISACLKKRPNGIVGFFGWNEVKGKDYRGGQSIQGSKEDRDVDVIKGRFMLFRRDLLDNVPLSPRVAQAVTVLHQDDIYLSMALGGGEPKKHLVPGVLGKRWRGLPDRGVGSYTKSGHYRRRNAALRAFKAYFQGGGNDT